MAKCPEQGVGVAKGQRRDARVGAHLRFVVERSELSENKFHLTGATYDASPELCVLRTT
jgi:hypothetical protein